MAALEPEIQRPPKGHQSHTVAATFAKSAIAALAVCGCIALGSFYTSGTHLFAPASGDNISNDDQMARAQAFSHLQNLVVARVAANELPGAINSMHLSADQNEKLSALLNPPAATTQTPAATQATANEPRQPVSAAATSPGAVPARVSTSALGQAPAAKPAPASARTPTYLAWVHLWDTDAEDGDVVRIESAGYARTVTLTKQGITFAVPVSGSGQIRITGVKDGDGGGVTVGIGSGSAQAILPIMSEGQTLTLNVRTN
ncbi:hypothetical protein [Paraburkholderia jirisanensis]